jgi:hydroxypyruvate isomerase
MIRQAAADWCFLKPEADRPAYYRRLRELGFDGVEMVAAVDRDAARAAGLELVTLSGPGMGDGLNHRGNHARLIPEIRAAIAEAQRERVANVIVFSGSRRGLDDETGIAACVEGLALLAPAAERAGVTLLFEALNTSDHADYHASRSAFAFAVVGRVASPALKVLYDLYHLHRMGDDAVADFRAHLPLIGHVHTAGAPKRDFPGPAQEIDYARLVRELTALGYRGYWGHEFYPGEDVFADLKRVRELFSAYAEETPSRQAAKSR